MSSFVKSTSASSWTAARLLFCSVPIPGALRSGGWRTKASRSSVRDTVPSLFTSTVSKSAAICGSPYRARRRCAASSSFVTDSSPLRSITLNAASATL